MNKLRTRGVRALLLTLAALPLIFGLSGTLIVGVALTAWGLVGAMDRWLERRREQYGPRARQAG